MRVLGLARGLVAACLLSIASAAGAATHMVRTTDDAGEGSLRHALAEAERGDSILFGSDVQGEIVLEEPLELDTEVSIKGPGAPQLTIRAAEDAALTVSAPVTITGVTIAGGDPAVVVEEGGLTLIECAVEQSAGAGIENRGAGLTLLRAAVVRNRGPGIRHEAGTTTCSNSTVADNGGAGVVADAGNVVGGNCTITGNRGAGLAAKGGEVTLQNSIVADNVEGCTGAVRSLGYNLTDDHACAFAATGDIISEDPRIAGLGRNGGPTVTAAPTGGSPAIDHGDPAGCTDPAGVGMLSVDQRGQRRPAGGRCDIGAVENQPEVAGVVVNRILALVDGEPITLYELKDFAAGDPRLRQALFTDPSTVLELLITKHLIALEVKKQGINVPDAEVDKYIESIKQRNQIDDAQLDAALAQQGLTRERYRAQIREELERAQLINREIRGKVSVSPEEIERYLQEQGGSGGGGEAASGGAIAISQIFLKIPADAPPDQVAAVEERAKRLYEELQGGADFADVAARESEDGAAKAGGKLGTFKPGELRDDLAEAVRELDPGEFSEPIRSSTGIHIVRLDERLGADDGASQRAADEEEIREQLYAKALEERYNRWLREDLRERHHVEIRQ